MVSVDVESHIPPDAGEKISGAERWSECLYENMYNSGENISITRENVYDSGEKFSVAER